MQEPRQTTAPFAVVADDNPVIALHAADILTEAGFSVFVASGADDALGWFAAHGDKVVLLFTNVEMPGSLDGFALARLVAKQSPHVGILVTSGRLSPRPGDMPPGAIFLAKPFSEEDVLAATRRALALKKHDVAGAVGLAL